jgi:ketosteroid isomerase-like protein
MDELEAIARKAIEAWNTHDVDQVLACYTPDLVYLDPNTRGELRGADAFRSYLGALFSAWKMEWRLRHVYPLSGALGAAATWTATLEPRGGAHPAVRVAGMDLALVQAGRIARNEVYFDRSALARP